MDGQAQRVLMHYKITDNTQLVASHKWYSPGLKAGDSSLKYPHQWSGRGDGGCTQEV